MVVENEISTNRNSGKRDGQYEAPHLADPAALKAFSYPFTLPVTGAVYAQPLVVRRIRLSVPDIQELLLIATDKNWLYLFDANSVSASEPLWKWNFGDFLPSGTFDDGRIPAGAQTFGIIGTPVFADGLLYLVADEFHAGETTHTLHAVDLLAEDVVNSVVVSGDAPGKDGTRIPFQSKHQVQRPGLLHDRGVIYIAFGAHAFDWEPYYGWVFAYEAKTLAQLGVFCTSSRNVSGPDWHTPTGALEPMGGAGIWQSGCGMSVDADGLVYAMTGNGSTAEGSYGNSFLRLRLDATAGDVDQRLRVEEFYRPPEDLNTGDEDLGSAGPVMVPAPDRERLVEGIGPARDERLIGGGKEGKLYLFDPKGLHVPLDVVAKIDPASSIEHTEGGIVSTPVYWSERQWLYLFAHGRRLHRFSLNIETAVEPGPLVPRVVQTEKLTAADPPSELLDIEEHLWYGPISLAKNSASTGVVWCVAMRQPPDAGKGDDPAGWLRAYDAVTLQVVWSRAIGAPDDKPLARGSDLARPVRFTPPTPHDKRVYVGAENAVHVFGLE